MKKIFALASLSYLTLNLTAQLPGEFKNFSQEFPEAGLQFKMIAIPAGTFLMGSAAGESGGKDDEGPARQVQLSAFWMGSHEVTHDEFSLFLQDESLTRNSAVDAITRPTPQYIDFSLGMGKQGGFPFNSMSQHTALMYCRWLYQRTGIFFRLPTEAEWEYACRAGTDGSRYHQSIDEYAWHEGNSDGKYHPVGLKKPNDWGLYDMLGNVSEWTLDQYEADYFTRLTDGVKDPVTRPGTRYPKSLRGGGYDTAPASMRCAARISSEPSWNRRDPQIPKSKWWMTDAASVGFRVVAPLHQPSPEQAAIFYDQYLRK